MIKPVWIATVLALATACLAVGDAPARADDVYTTHTCRGPDGGPAPVDGWSFHGVSVGHRSDCLTGGDIAAGPPYAEYGAEQYFAWHFDAPPDTRIVAWTLYRTVDVPKTGPWGWAWGLFRDAVSADQAHRREQCWDSCWALGDGTVSEASRVEESDVDLQRLIGIVGCSPVPCPPNSGGKMWIHRGAFTLRDLSDPAFVGTPAGDLLDGSRPLAGVRTASFSATDKGGGVYKATVEVDGAPVISEIVDDNGGHCVPPFTGAVPCKANASGSISVDTTAIPDGVHSVRLVVSDPTETNTAVFGPVQVTTTNGSPECDPLVRSNVTPVLAGFRGTRRLTVTRRNGRTTVVGRIAGVESGTLVHLISREQRTGAPSQFAGTTVTEADGSYALSVPRGPSRRLRAAYRVRPTDPLLACSRAVNLRVPARATLSASPRQVRPGGQVRLSGRLLGGSVPRRGKLVDLQARSGGAWRTFATARSDSRGRFQSGYRFSRRAVSATYPIRVRVRADANYPYDLGYSRAVRVRVH